MKMTKIGIILSLVLIFINGCVVKEKPISGGDYIRDAIIVWDGGKTFSTNEEVKSFFIQNSNTILNNTLGLYDKYPNLDKTPIFEDSKKMLESTSDQWSFLWSFANSEVKFQSCCAQMFWTGDASASNYVVIIPSANTKIEEKVICNDPAETPNTNEATGESGCGSGIKERQPINRNSKLYYIVDNQGKIYFAGGYFI